VVRGRGRLDGWRFCQGEEHKSFYGQNVPDAIELAKCIRAGHDINWPLRIPLFTQ